MLLYIMLYIMLAYLMLFAVCLYNAIFLPLLLQMLFVFMLCLRLSTQFVYFEYYFASYSVFNLLVLLILCSLRFFNEGAMCSLDK